MWSGKLESDKKWRMIDNEALLSAKESCQFDSLSYLLEPKECHFQALWLKCNT